MRALVLNCTLKPSPSRRTPTRSRGVVVEALEAEGVDVDSVRVVDDDVKPGVSSDEGSGDAWPQIRSRILASETRTARTTSSASSRAR